MWYGYQILDGKGHLLGDEGDEAYYSFSSSDPSVSGLSYDSPVIIDRT